ncbi:MAG: carboxypeptidase regulatory-like domain-containing protein, partial [Methanobacterium sp.]
MKYCSQCGQQLPDQARFCGACGMAFPELAAGSAQTVAMSDPQPAAVANQPEAGIQPQDNAYHAIPIEVPIETAPKGRLGLTGKIIIASVLSLLMIGGGFWGWWNMNTESRVQSKLNLAVKYLSENNYEKAILAYNDAIKIEPKEVMAYQGLAKTYTLQGKYDAAKDAYERGLAAVAADDKTDLQLSQAGLYIDQNKLIEAEKKLQDIITKKAECIEAYQGLSMIYTLQNDSEKARQIIEKAMQKNPQSYQALNLSASLDMIDDPEQALEMLLKSLQLEPDQQEAFSLLKDMYEGRWNDLLAKIDDSSKLKAAALIKMFVYDQRKEYRDVIRIYESQSANQPSSKSSILAAICYQQTGDSKKAEELIDKVIKGNPNAWIMVDIAWYYKTSGNEKEALAYANQAFETGEGNLEALKLLAEALGSEQQNLAKLMTAMHIVYNWQPIIYINKELAREKIEPCFAIAGNEGWPGDFKGTITDADSGAAISGAALEIYDANGRMVSRIVTDAHGKYNASLSSGDYRLLIKALLYTSKEQSNFTVTNEDGTVFDSALKKSASASGLKGIIQDAVSRAPIADAKIEVLDASKKKISTICSDATGKFELLLLPAENYTIKISKEGYLPENYEGIAITANNTVFLETILQVQSSSAKGS